MQNTLRRNPAIADAADACESIAAEVEALAWEADLLRLVREGECAADVLALLRHRARTSKAAKGSGVGRMSAITASVAVLKCSIDRLAVGGLEAEILRLARVTGCVAEMRDLAAVHAKKRRFAEQYGEAQATHSVSTVG